MERRSIHREIDSILLELNAGVIEPEADTYIFIVSDEDGGHMRTARKVDGVWILQKH